jgi:DNA replication protein DnaC
VSRRFESREPGACSRCGGDGFVLDDSGDAIPCECRPVMVRRSRSVGVSSVIPRRYRGVSFDRAPISELPPNVMQPARRFIEKLNQNLDGGHGLWLIGDVGTGKTSLAMLVSKLALKEGRSVAIYSVPRLLGDIRNTYDDAGRNYGEFFEALVTVDLLHLDDLGAERQTPWVLEQLYSLINERYEAQRSILVTSNLTWEEAEQQMGKRTISRLTEMTDQIPMFGEDLREGYDPARSALA